MVQSQTEIPGFALTGTLGAKMFQMETPSLEELKASDWYQTRPDSIKAAIEKTPPTKMYRFKDSQKECYIIGYTEPSEPDGETTLIVQKTGRGGAISEMGLGALDTNQVFDVNPEDLEESILTQS